MKSWLDWPIILQLIFIANNPNTKSCDLLFLVILLDMAHIYQLAPYVKNVLPMNTNFPWSLKSRKLQIPNF